MKTLVIFLALVAVPVSAQSIQAHRADGTLCANLFVADHRIEYVNGCTSEEVIWSVFASLDSEVHRSDELGRRYEAVKRELMKYGRYPRIQPTTTILGEVGFTLRCRKYGEPLFMLQRPSAKKVKEVCKNW